MYCTPPSDAYVLYSVHHHLMLIYRTPPFEAYVLYTTSWCLCTVPCTPPFDAYETVHHHLKRMYCTPPFYACVLYNTIISFTCSSSSSANSWISISTLLSLQLRFLWFSINRWSGSDPVLSRLLRRPDCRNLCWVSEPILVWRLPRRPGWSSWSKGNTLPFDQINFCTTWTNKYQRKKYKKSDRKF